MPQTHDTVPTGELASAIRPEERRRCPEDGKVYNFGELLESQGLRKTVSDLKMHWLSQMQDPSLPLSLPSPSATPLPHPTPSTTQTTALTEGTACRTLFFGTGKIPVQRLFRTPHAEGLPLRGRVSGTQSSII